MKAPSDRCSRPLRPQVLKRLPKLLDPDDPWSEYGRPDSPKSRASAHGGRPDTPEEEVDPHVRPSPATRAMWIG